MAIILDKKRKKNIQVKNFKHILRHGFNRTIQRITQPNSWPLSISVRVHQGPHCITEMLTNPLRVVHLTDQHVGRVTPMKVQLKAIEYANRSNPDLVVLTGDFVCHSEVFLEDLSYIIGLINAPKFAVLGNHDHWTNNKQVIKALTRGGAEVLTNKNTVIELQREKIQLVGLDDAYTNHADVAVAVKRMKKNLPTIALSHIAEEADKLWHYGIPLVLSGHTHAGQVTVAKLNEFLLKKFVGHKYIHGFYNSSNFPDYRVYVSAGIGAAIMPLRIGECGKREVAIFDFGDVAKDFPVSE